MGSACISAGVITFVLSTIARSLSQSAGSPIWIRKLFGIPLQDSREIILGFIAQLAGIFWILIGIFLVKVDKLLSLSLLGIVCEFLIAFSPVIISITVLRFLIAMGSKKQ